MCTSSVERPERSSGKGSTYKNTQKTKKDKKKQKKALKQNL